MELPLEQTIKKQVPEHLDKEQPLLELSGTVDEIDNVIVELDGSNLTPEQQLRLTIIKGNVINSIRKLSRVMRSVAVTGAIIGSIALGSHVVMTATASIGHEINHHALEETTDASGETIYTHPDERTTHYLNILAGRDKFTEEDLKYAKENNRTVKDLNMLAGLERSTDEDVERMDRRSWEKVLKNSGLPLPANIGEMSSWELIALLAKVNLETVEAKRLAQDSAIAHTQKTTRELNERAELRSSVKNDMYNLVWKLEEEGGNPKIRFNAESPNFNLFPEPKDRNKYYLMSNTIYIDVDALMNGEGVVAEMSHGKQFKDNILGSSLRGIRDKISVILKSGFGVRGFQKEYDKLYERSGSIEYEAHKVIQPDLEKRYPLRSYSKQQPEGKSK